MFESLQRSSVPDVSGILLTAAILWGIWPVACGVIGAMRGQAIQGAIHGFLWGPIGIIVILMTHQKYECPTCGHNTLRQPYDETAGPPLVPGLGGPKLARRVSNFSEGYRIDIPEPMEAKPEVMQSPPVVGQGVHARVARPVSPSIPRAASGGAVNADGAASSSEEAEKLRAWVNAD